MKQIIFIILFMFLLSCKENKNNQEEKSLVIDSVTTNNTSYKNEDKQFFDEKKLTSLDDLWKILENKGSFSDNDYSSLFKNLEPNDESIGEGLGYLIFDYYYKDKEKCKNLKKYLETLEKNQRDKNLKLLIKIMCLEITINEYKNLNSFSKDFSFVPNEDDSLKNTFEECLSNQIID